MYLGFTIYRNLMSIWWIICTNSILCINFVLIIHVFKDMIYTASMMNLSHWSSSIWRNVIYLEADITKCFIIAWRWYYLTCNSTPTLSNFGQHKHMVYLTIVMYNFLKFAAKNVSDNLCKGLGCYRSYWRANCLD